MNNDFDVMIIGGGLAGLSAAYLLARAGHRICVAERNEYPTHKVCGEYISRENLHFLNESGIFDGSEPFVPISRFALSAPSGNMLSLPLPLGGIGLSRYYLDNLLAQKSTQAGATIMTKTNVQAVSRNGAHFRIQTNRGEFYTQHVIAASGKKMQFGGTQASQGKFIGVKYHVRYDHPSDLIALHNFSDGYCGISQVEGGICCLCYLSTKENLRKSGGIAELERKVLSQNPHLKKIFEDAEFLWDAPKVVQDIDFRRRPQVCDGMFFCGDSAGMISPLSGNGMSMALHSSAILSRLISSHLSGTISQQQLESDYTAAWSELFSLRVFAGRTIQRFFGHPLLSELLVSTFRPLPHLGKRLIALTHGREYGMK